MSKQLPKGEWKEALTMVYVSTEGKYYKKNNFSYFTTIHAMTYLYDQKA